MADDTNTGAEQAQEAAQPAAAEKVAKTEKKVKTVRMKRDPEQYPEPHTADVHPAEVEAYAAGGWVATK